MHPYPLIRGGGLFLILVGAGIVSGAVWPQARRRLLGWSLALASVVTALFAARLARPFGLPTALQIGVLVGAVLTEGVVVGLVVRRLQQQDDRTVELAVMFVVGVHFLPMTLAFGPLVGVLGVLVVLNAAAGLWLARGTDLLVFWTVDGLSKMVFGGIMLFIALT